MRRYVLPAVAVILAAGCGGSSHKVVPAEGVVTINGQPAAGIYVQFLPDSQNGSGGPTSSAVSGPDGTFKLRTDDGRDGAVAGPHLVALTDTEEERPDQGKPLTRPSRLDHRLSIPTSGLKVNVSDGGGPIRLDATGPRR